MCISKNDAKDSMYCWGRISLIALLLIIPGVALVSIYPSNYSIKETGLVGSTCVRRGPCTRGGSYYLGYSPEYNMDIVTQCSTDLQNLIIPDSSCSEQIRMYYYKYRLVGDVHPSFVPYPVVHLFIAGCIFIILGSIPIIGTLVSLIAWISYPNPVATPNHTPRSYMWAIDL